MTRAIRFGMVLGVLATVWSCASGGNSDAELGVTNPPMDAGPTGHPPVPSNETERDAAPSPVESSTRDAASPMDPAPVADAGCHMIVVHAGSKVGVLMVPLCEEDVGCDTGDDAGAAALDPEGTCWSFPKHCVPEIWIAEGWQEVVECPPERPSPEAGTEDASAPEMPDAGNTTSLDGAASVLDAAPLDASIDAAP
jgi:hypothetical protein